MDLDPKEIVRRGYDAVSASYDQAFGGATKYQAWLSQLRDAIPAGGTVLDLGCGSGLPVALNLTEAGFEVTGVDISDVQINRARELVPQAKFFRADAMDVEFAPESFDAVVSFYALIHLPVPEHLPLLTKVATWLRPGGLFVATTGQHEWIGAEEDWLGTGATMWWSHADADSYRTWISDCGLIIERDEFVPEGDVGHAFFWARRPP
jgi:cyclopropane fatty-acyl-phospholipid synthase-like methyltransferase